MTARPFRALIGVIATFVLPALACTGGTAPRGTPPGTGGDTEGTGGGAAGGAGTPATGGSTGTGGGAGQSGNGGRGASGGSGGASGGAGGATAGAGGRADAAATGGNAGQPDAAAPDRSGNIYPVPPGTPRRAGFKIFHSTNVSMWEIADASVYDQNKAAFDEIIDLLERGYFGIEARLGTGHKLPIRVIIEAGGCCGGWAGGGDVGYNDGNFKSAGGVQWTRGVVIGEVVNGVTGAVSSEWPRDWWADTAWYFPGFIAAAVLKELNPAAGAKWEVDEKYPTYPTYVLFRALQQEKGWAIYQKLFQLVKTDKMAWDRIGANPSALKTNYTIAYISLAYGQNLGDRFKTAGKVSAADPAVIEQIMDAREKLAAAGANAAGWTRFRMGTYQGL